MVPDAARVLRERWDAQRLQSALQPLAPGLRVEVVAETGSTNADLMEAAREAPRPATVQIRLRPPCLLVAEVQRQGRGRQGKAWHACSEAGARGSLTFSVALTLAPRDWRGLSLAVGVALAEALDPIPLRDHGVAPRIGLKWPNDLWLIDASTALGGRKLGGILIETAGSAAADPEARTCVVGVGLNLRHPLQGRHTAAVEAMPRQPPCAASATADMPAPPAPTEADFASGIAWLGELDPDAHAPDVLAAVAAPLLTALRRFEREGLAPALEGFGRRDLLRGQRVRATGGVALHGVAEGVNADGSLRLRTDDGRTEALHSGELSVRAQPAELPC